MVYIEQQEEELAFFAFRLSSELIVDMQRYAQQLVSFVGTLLFLG